MLVIGNIIEIDREREKQTQRQTDREREREKWIENMEIKNMNE